MSLINEGLVCRMRWPPLSAPIEAGVGDYPQGSEGCAVSVIERQVAVRISQLITEKLVGPSQLPADRLGVGVEQQFVRIEAQSALGNVGSVHPITVQLARAHIRHVNVPRAAGALADADAPFLIPRCVEQAEFDGLGVLGEQGKIDALTIPIRAAREG